MVLEYLQIRQVLWPQAHRIIASRFPPIRLFERASLDPDVWDALIALEEATNPRLRDEVGEISMVPRERRVFGPGASFVMAPFTHRNPKGSRFSDGSYGLYYAADSFETALAEVCFHFARFAADSGDDRRTEDMRCLVGAVDGAFVDVTALPLADQQVLLDPVSYSDSRPFAAYLRSIGQEGLFYPSVRRLGGYCVAVFYPDCVAIPIQTRHIRIEFDGRRVWGYWDLSSGNFAEI